MIHFVACSRVASKSGRALAAAITELQGRKCRYRCRNLPGNPHLRHVNYGYQASWLDPDSALNRFDAAYLASNKLNALKEMDECGVCVPQIFTVEEANLRPGCHLIYRKQRHHAGSALAEEAG